jgi:hypothetical protein
VRLAVVIGAPVVLILAGVVYLLAKPKEDARLAAILARAEQAGQSPVDAADADDTALVRKLLENRNLTDSQIISLIGASGRRYVRRKVAYAEAEEAVQSGHATPLSLESMRRDVDLARKVYDFAELLDRHNREANAMAIADWELERRLSYGPSALMGMGLVDRYTGTEAFSDADLKAMDEGFQKAFGRPLPVSAKGDSAAHRRMGFDHRGRVDVAVSPLQPEGIWVRRYLSGKGVTFFAYSSAVRGKATGAHIHIGAASGRVGRAVTN